QYAFRPIPETADAWLPAFSPDGRWLAYFDAGVMRRMPVGGGASTRVTDVTGYFSGYGWGDDGWVVHAPYWGRGIARVHHEGGGRGEFLTSVDFANNEFAHVNASVVRGTPWVLYAVWDGKDGLRIDAIDAKTKRRHTVVESGTCPKVARTPYGPHLLWERAGTVYAAPFDLDTALRTGPAVTVAEGVMNDRVLFYSVYDVADDGTLAYVPGPMFLQDVRLAWLKPGDAAATPFNDDQLPFVEPNFSADGNLLTVILKNDVFTPYVYHLKAKTFDRIVVPGDCESAAISPDGKRLAYTANPDGPYNVYVKDLASGTIDQIDSGLVGYPCAIGWSPDGRSVAYAGRLDEWAQRDVFVVDVATRTRRGFAASPGVEERSPRFSPDGKWIAYMGNDSGQREVLIRSYPSGAQTRQVSFGGGDWPQWSPDGKQVYYRARGKLYATTIDPATGGVVYRGRLVYDRPFGQSSFEMPDYTVHPDGRLLLVEPTPAGPGVAQVNVIVNWHELLRPRS
ncbi:MAG TPA: hypothetical protein VK324_16240, partial [Tepidisphaeraceae bacterium]|nr:hypothetical protein [Tepidisphaeraceae bacterium]